MRKYLIAISVMLASVSFHACNDDDNMPDIKPVASGTFTDERDGNTYGWIRVGDLEWMTENLRYGEPYYEREYGGIFEDPFDGPQPVISNETIFDFEADYATNGNLYTWEEACESAPEGWRLATDEDWKNLEMALGMSESEANEEGWRGEFVGTLLRQGEDGLGMNLPLSGWAWQSGSYGFELYLSNLGEFGYFWTATEKENDGLEVQTVYFRSIFATYNTVKRYTSPLNVLMRARYVRDALE